VIARGAHVNGIVAAERLVVDGKVEGPIQGGDVVLKSQAHVVGVAARMSGHEQTSRHVRVMSVIPLKADIHQRGLHVRFVPRPDMIGDRWLSAMINRDPGSFNCL
jgi:hypothetical protein